MPVAPPTLRRAGRHPRIRHRRVRAPLAAPGAHIMREGSPAHRARGSAEHRRPPRRAPPSPVRLLAALWWSPSASVSGRTTRCWTYSTGRCRRASKTGVQPAGRADPRHASRRPRRSGDAAEQFKAALHLDEHLSAGDQAVLAQAASRPAQAARALPQKNPKNVPITIGVGEPLHDLVDRVVLRRAPAHAAGPALRALRVHAYRR